MKILHLILLSVLAVPSTANAQVSRRCLVEEDYPGECVISVDDNFMNIVFYRAGGSGEGYAYRWTKTGEGRFRDEEGNTWNASGNGQSTIFTSWQCPPRQSCGEFKIQIWN